MPNFYRILKQLLDYKCHKSVKETKPYASLFFKVINKNDLFIALCRKIRIIISVLEMKTLHLQIRNIQMLQYYFTFHKNFSLNFFLIV